LVSFFSLQTLAVAAACLGKSRALDELQVSLT
jgi:hypothetical protein